MSNSPSGLYDTIGQLIIEAELGQARPQDDHMQRITYGNLVVGQGQYPSLTTPPEANQDLDYESNGVDTASDPSLSSF